MDTVFFIASKLLAFIFSPITWIFFLLLLAVLSKKPKKTKVLLLISTILLYLFSNSFIVDEVMRLWEVPPVRIENLKKDYDYIVVLGGMMSYYDSKNNQIGVNKSIDRLMQAIKLYKKGYGKKILISGGDGSLLKTIGKEADFLKNYITDIGLYTDDMIFESESQNTYENAKYSAQIIKKDSAKKVLIVTSAFHMRRAMACFKKQGIYADYYPAERYAGKRKYTFDHLLLPNINALESWEKLIHEFIGFITYKIAGYI